MKKLLSFIISAVVVIGLAVGVAFIVMHLNNNKEHKLTVTSDFYGSIQAAINDNEYNITANNSKTYNVTKQSSITLTAIPETGYTFVEWKLNGATYSSELEINLSVSKDTEIKAVFSASSVDVTVVDGTNFNDTFKYNVADNLLTTLNNKYVAGKGYAYSYSIDGTPVTANTTINANTTITRTKAPITYTVTFKDGNTVIETKNYTVENQTVTAPTYAVDHYNITWDIQIPTDLGNFEVVANKTPVVYTVTFKDGDTTIGTDTYTVEDKTITAPTYTIEHYDIDWNVQIPTNLGNFEVVATKTPVVYTATFKLPAGYTFDDETTEKVVEYTIENLTVVSPALPEAHQGYTIAWSEYTIDADNMDNITVDAVLTKIPYTATFTLPSGFTFEDGTTTADVTYYIDTVNLECPKSVETREHYEMSWGEIDLTFDAENPYIINGSEAPINYPINIKEGEEVLQTIYYNIENKDSVVAPTITIKHYNVTVDIVIPAQLGEVNVQIEKTPVVYTVTYKLPTGYKFADNSTSKNVDYTIENFETVSAPAFPEVENVIFSWPTEITADNIDAVTEIEAVAEVYTKITVNVDPHSSLDGEDSEYIYEEIFLLSSDAENIYKKGATMVIDCTKNEFAERMLNNYPNVTFELCVKVNDVVVTTVEEFKTEFFKDGVTSATIWYGPVPEED